VTVCRRDWHRRDQTDHSTGGVWLRGVVVCRAAIKRGENRDREGDSCTSDWHREIVKDELHLLFYFHSGVGALDYPIKIDVELRMQSYFSTSNFRRNFPKISPLQFGSI
jgi:hypothetical protein